MDDGDRRTFGFLMDVTLSESEIKAQLERNADIDRKMIEIKGEKAGANSEFNADLKTLRKEQETLLTSINTGKTKLEVQCYHDKDDRRGMMLTRRADNGFIVDERALTADELHEARQGSLFDNGNTAAPPAIADGEDVEENPDADTAASLEEYAKLQAANGNEGESQVAPASADEADPDDEGDDEDQPDVLSMGSEELPH